MKLPPEIHPLVKTQITKAGYILETTSALALIATWIISVVAYNLLPDNVPIHYGMNGKADNWGSKINIFVIPFISMVLIFGISILNKFPHKFNYPVKVTDENAQKLYFKGTQAMRIIKVSVSFLFLLIEFLICCSTENAQLPVWFLPAILMIPVVLPIVLAFWFTNYFSKDKTR